MGKVSRVSRLLAPSCLFTSPMTKRLKLFCRGMNIQLSKIGQSVGYLNKKSATRRITKQKVLLTAFVLDTLLYSSQQGQYTRMKNRCQIQTKEHTNGCSFFVKNSDYSVDFTRSCKCPIARAAASLPPSPKASPPAIASIATKPVKIICMYAAAIPRVPSAIMSAKIQIE